MDTTTQVIYQKTMTDGQKQTWVQLVNDTDVLDGMGFSTGMTASQGAIVELLWQEEQQDIQAKWLGEFEFKGLCGYGLVHIANNY